MSLINHKLHTWRSAGTKKRCVSTVVPVLDFSKPLNCTGQALNPGPRPICMLLNRCKHVHLEPGQIMADHYQTLVKTRRTEEISFKHYCCVSTEELQPSEEVVFKLTWDGPPYGFITNCPCPHFSSRFQRKKKTFWYMLEMKAEFSGLRHSKYIQYTAMREVLCWAEWQPEKDLTPK